MPHRAIPAFPLSPSTVIYHRARVQGDRETTNHQTRGVVRSTIPNKDIAMYTAKTSYMYNIREILVYDIFVSAILTMGNSTVVEYYLQYFK